MATRSYELASRFAGSAPHLDHRQQPGRYRPVGIVDNTYAMASSTLIRVYHGTNRDKTAHCFHLGADRLARDGWEVSFQSWDPPQGSHLRTIAHLWVLEFFHRPKGTLTVTYRSRPAPGAGGPE
jgi:hypothetical protein